MSDKIDEIFENIDNTYIDYITSKFICDKCKEERPTYRSVMLAGSQLKSITGCTRVCERCYWKIYEELKGEQK